MPDEPTVFEKEFSFDEMEFEMCIRDRILGKLYFKIGGIFLLTLCIATFTACQNSDENKKASKDIFAMDTYMTCLLYTSGQG